MYIVHVRITNMYSTSYIFNRSSIIHCCNSSSQAIPLMYRVYKDHVLGLILFVFPPCIRALYNYRTSTITSKLDI